MSSNLTELESAIAKIDAQAESVAEGSMRQMNLDRCEAAAYSLRYAAREFGGVSAESEPVSVMIRDMLANLRHLADLTGVDFDAEDYSAVERYVEECREAADEAVADV
jgi:hypothetical protein